MYVGGKDKDKKNENMKKISNKNIMSVSEDMLDSALALFFFRNPIDACYPFG